MTILHNQNGNWKSTDTMYCQPSIIEIKEAGEYFMGEF